uniref:Sushi domain-containing protein n=1 Tax=Taeniopygia guttata TaxID=59729 RepID=A0A674HVD1_TAEGU
LLPNSHEVSPSLCRGDMSSLNFHFPPAVRPCPMPPEVANGKHNGQDKAFFTAGMAVRYSCDPGYYLVGNAAVSCRASGNWSQPRPRCAGESGLCPIGGHGLLSAPGQTVTFRCHDGYSLQGSASVSCQEDGSWQPPAPVCARAPPHHRTGLRFCPLKPCNSLKLETRVGGNWECGQGTGGMMAYFVL